MTIKDLRKKYNKTQKELADAIGVSVTVISKYESGIIIPPKNRLDSIEKFFGERPDIYDNNDFLWDNNSFIEYLPAHKNQVSPHVMAYAKLIEKYYLKKMLILQSKGCCELCQNPAPFLDNDGQPFLILRDLKNDNVETDTTPEKHCVVLCPNCNAKIETLNNQSDIEYLQEIALKHNFFSNI